MGRATVTITVGLLLAGSALPGALALAHDDDPKAFEVTVTNLTRG